jgi:hypothetical protein
VANGEDYRNRLTSALLQSELAHLREFVEGEFDELRKYVALQFEGHERVQHERDRAVDERLVQHEKRLASVEKQERWRWAGQALTMLAAFYGIRTGIE